MKKSAKYDTIDKENIWRCKMKINEKGFLLKFFLALAIANIFVYALYHASYLMGYSWFEYVHIYIAEMWEFLFVPVSVVLMLVVRREGGKLGSFKVALLCSVARVFYTIPFYYMEYMRNSYPPNSFDSIIVSSIYTVFEILVTLIHLFAICGIIFFVCRVRGKGDKNYLQDSLLKEASFDFSSPASVICLVACLCQFAIKLVGVVSVTISFLVEFGGGYTLGEILLILFDYVVCIALLPLSYIAICRLKKEFVDQARDE